MASAEWYGSPSPQSNQTDSMVRKSCSGGAWARMPNVAISHTCTPSAAYRRTDEDQIDLIAAEAHWRTRRVYRPLSHTTRGDETPVLAQNMPNTLGGQ